MVNITEILFRFWSCSQKGCVLLFLCCAIDVHPSQGQTLCGTATVQLAQTAYGIGRFPTLYQLLNPCLPDGFTDKETGADAYRLLALSYVATDSLGMAKESIKHMLKYDSSFRANPETDPPVFVELVSAEIPAWYTFMWKGNSTTRWLARGAVVGALVLLPTMLSSNSTPDLPGPPITPADD